MTENPTLPVDYDEARSAKPDPLGLTKFDGDGKKKDDNKKKPKVNKTIAFVDALIITIVITSGSLAFGSLLSQGLLNVWDSWPKSEDVLTRIEYPNPFGFQYVLPDKNRPVIEVARE